MDMKRLFCIFCALVLFSAAAVPARAAGPQVSAKSAVLMDVATGTVLCEQDAHARLAPASVTKVMTMLLIMEAIDSGVIKWSDTVTASETAAAKGGSQVYLKAGETMTVEEMLKSIAVSSANDCACAMAEHLCGSESAFVDAMNKRAEELGMADTHFVNCTGLDDDPAAKEHLTSAWDIAIMSRELLGKHPDIKKFTTIWMDTIRGGSFGLSNTNKLVRFYNGATGLKTGFTSGAGYCLSSSALRDGMELVAVVMGCESSQERFAACKSLLDYGFATYALITPELPEQLSVPVKLGKQDTVPVTLENAEAQLLEKAQKSMAKITYEVDESVTAPVSRGQRLGTLRIMAGEQILSELPLTAAEPVDRISFGGMLLQVLRGYI